MSDENAGTSTPEDRILFLNPGFMPRELAESPEGQAYAEAYRAYHGDVDSVLDSLKDMGMVTYSLQHYPPDTVDQAKQRLSPAFEKTGDALVSWQEAKAAMLRAASHPRLQAFFREQHERFGIAYTELPPGVRPPLS